MEATHELVATDATLDIATARVDTQGGAGNVVVAHHQHVRQLLHLGGANALAQLIVGIDDVDAEALGLQHGDDGLGVLLVSSGYGQHARLQRRHPGGKRPGVVLDQHTEEPFDGPEEGAVQHDGPVASFTSMSIFGP